MRASIHRSFTFVCALLAVARPAAFVVAAPNGTAAASPSPAPSASADDTLDSTDGGTIDGHISSIDYKSGRMTVDVAGPHKKSYDVLVVPGTNIQAQNDFHTIADLKKGAHVQVLMSRHGSVNTAQIIHLR